MALCSRCGADLLPLRQLLVRSRWLRDRARELLLCGEAESAEELLLEAQELHWTRKGEDLQLLARWHLVTSSAEAPVRAR